MKLYFKVGVLLVYLFTMVGGILPYLISSTATELVALGLTLGVVSVPIVGWYIKKFILNQSKEENV